jgi:hypothetical protein
VAICPSLGTYKVIFVQSFEIGSQNPSIFVEPLFSKMASAMVSTVWSARPTSRSHTSSKNAEIRFRLFQLVNNVRLTVCTFTIPFFVRTQTIHPFSHLPLTNPRLVLPSAARTARSEDTLPNRSNRIGVERKPFDIPIRFARGTRYRRFAHRAPNGQASPQV